jgi:hypothetical protein
VSGVEHKQCEDCALLLAAELERTLFARNLELSEDPELGHEVVVTRRGCPS